VSDESPRQLIERRLREMASDACDVIAGSIGSDGRVPRGQQTRSADAWRVIDALRGVDSVESATPNSEGVSEADELAVRRLALQAALRAKRADK